MPTATRARLTRAGIVLTATMAWGAAGPSSVRAEVIDRILAVVAGRPILLSDVRAARDLSLVAASDDEPDEVGGVLDALIDRELMLTEVERFVPPEPAPAAVDGRVEAARGRFETPAAFEAALARSGIDESQLRETIRATLRIQSYLDLRFAVPTPSDEEIARYYREHLDDFADAGGPGDFDVIRPRVIQAMNAGRRQALVDDWLAGLRRRADIVRLHQGN